MNESQVKDLIFSLAWLPHSSHHSRNVRELLKQAFPDSDFEVEIEVFKENCLSSPGEGSPK